MKVKELVGLLKVSSEDLLKKLQNVGVDITPQEETLVDKNTEKKLARLYNVPYPFKSEKVTKKPAPVPSSPKPIAKPAVPVAPIAQAAPKVAPPVAKAPAPKVPAPQTAKPVQREGTPAPKPIAPKPVFVERKTYPAEAVAPRVDEKTLNKYGEYLEKDEFNINREHKGKRPGRDEFDSRKKGNKAKPVATKVLPKKTGKVRNRQKAEASDEKVIYYEPGMTVAMVADQLNVPITELVKKMFISLGLLVSANNSLDFETTQLIAIDYAYEVKEKKITDMLRFDEMELVDAEDALVARPAVVTIMGHVDHGKTTLLDTIRSSHVVQGEAGGITQHIGAYQVVKNGELITFIDTPGHAAFTEMRARGAQITDIVVLVVAADDGVMPQTKEAIEHAKAAKVPIIVAINKMDRPGASPDRIKQELTSYDLVAEEWGGDTIFVEISALTGKGVDTLLEMILLVSGLNTYKANPNRPGAGTVIEAKLTKGRGPAATLLVQNGTIKVGDIIVVGNTYGKIRAMQDELGRSVLKATPSKPVEITGIAEVPCAGDRFIILNDEKRAREIADVRTQNKFNLDKGVGQTISLNDAFKNKGNEEIKQLNLIIKCDVQGSIEAIKGLLEKIKIEGTKISIVASRVGGISDNDINLAIATKSVIIGFNIRPQAAIMDLAKEKGIEIRLYDIIYKLQEDIEKAVKGMLDPVFEEKISGEALVREIFKVSKIGTIAGCYVTSGIIPRNAGVRLIRDSVVVYTGRLSSLKRFKDDVKEVKTGFECGITIENFNDIKIGDVLECFIMEEIERE